MAPSVEEAPRHLTSRAYELRAALIVLRHAAKTKDRSYDAPIRDLINHACGNDASSNRWIDQLMTVPRGTLMSSGIDCRRILPADDRDDDPGDAVLVLAHLYDAKDQEIAVEVACAMCRETGSHCTCDGKACELRDLVPSLPRARETLTCGTYTADGNSYRWGAAVRALPSTRIDL